MPRPKRKKGESIQKYRSRLIRHYIREGYPQKQAAAIAYRLTGTGRVGKRRKKQKKRR